MRKLLLIDGNALMNAAYWAMPNLTTSDGTPTGALYGFITQLGNLMGRVFPDKVVVFFDKGRPERKDMYESYKEGRPQKDQNFTVQFPFVEEYLNTAGIPIVSVEHVEADDLIASLVHKLYQDPYNSNFREEDTGLITYIGTRDKDLLNLCSFPGVVVLLQKGGNIIEYDANAVANEFGVTVTQFLDFKALVGDSSDNIPGVKGVGPVAASNILHKYATVAEGYRDGFLQLNSMALKTKLLNAQSDYYLSLDLVRPIIKDTVLTWDSIPANWAQGDALNNFFDKYELNSLKV